MISGHGFAARLAGHGFDFFTGVPCSLIEDLIAVLERDSRAPYVAAVREDAAVGLAAGAWFGGRRPVVLMQNSGLGTSLNALASLSLMYGLPVLLVVTWRGFGGRDAPEHILTGEISPRLLELLAVPYRVLAADSLDADLAWAAAGVVALFVVAVLILWFLDSAGRVSLRGDAVPDLTRMDAGSFTIEYPKGWDQRCENDVSGYPVCGIANHSFYNQVQLFSGTDVDLGRMMADSIGMMFGGGNLPEDQVSIIVMDVPQSSPSYDGHSWAKTNNEWVQDGWVWDRDAKTNYERDEISVDGFKAYYHEFTSEGDYREAAWDVYIEHDGIIFWMRVDYWGPRDRKIPHNLVKEMIESIHLRPVEEWSSDSS